jgi:rRNA-processing protein FCF1
VKKLRIYLDTSIINFLFADDAPDLKKITKELFKDFIKKEKYLFYISDVVIKEIEKTKDESHKIKLLNIIKDYNLRILTISEEAEKLSLLYIKDKVIPERKIEDAQHIAIATIDQLDVLLSWNFKHLANIKKQLAVKLINEREGYFYPLILTNPMEVMNESEE